MVPAEQRFPLRTQLRRRRPAKFTAEEDDRLVEQTSLVEVGNQGTDSAITFFCAKSMFFFEFAMIVPRLILSVPTLYEPHTSFDESPGNQQLPPLGRIAVHFLDVFGLTVDIKSITGRSLHPIGEFVRFNPCVECIVFSSPLTMGHIQFLQQVELNPLLGEANFLVAYIRDKSLDFGINGIDECPLVDRGQKRTPPIIWPGNRQPPGQRTTKPGKLRFSVPRP